MREQLETRRGRAGRVESAGRRPTQLTALVLEVRPGLVVPRVELTHPIDLARAREHVERPVAPSRAVSLY